jgi:heme-degrading monooxygenase HmoA
MAVIVTADVPDGTRAQADDWAAATSAALATAPGFVAQTDHETKTGWRVVSIWESEAHFRRYFDLIVAPKLPPHAPAPIVVEAERLVRAGSR